MAPKRKKNEHGIFSGMVMFFVPNGVQTRRLQIWKDKVEQMGGSVEESVSVEGLTHIFALDSHSLLQWRDQNAKTKTKTKPTNTNNTTLLPYRWIEDCLTSGEKLPEDIDHYRLSFNPEPTTTHQNHPQPNSNANASQDQDNAEKVKSCQDRDTNYNPPNLNPDITRIFSSLIDIYRALGDDRRSFSYYKAIPVIEKLPFKIKSADEVKHLPSIGKSLQDHIQEIVTTGKLSKLDHFQTDEKVKTIALFGQVWGVGPATALKLYEKGHRTLDDLRNEPFLTNAQKIGLKYFHDIQQRIPRHEVQEMESLLRKVAEEVVSGMEVTCGGSYRRGKATCGDMDVVITHPDGISHKGFLQKFVKHLKDMNFLREDLIFSTHSQEGTDSGVDTYFGLCTYPGRELRHRIDFKVYPRDIFAFGLIAWTGNDVLNRRLRLLAESKGFRLDDTGLYPVTHGLPGKRGTKGTASLKFKEEKEVFDFLGFPWLEPQDRNL